MGTRKVSGIVGESSALVGKWAKSIVEVSWRALRVREVLMWRVLG